MFEKIFLILLILILYIPVAYAQTIPITISSSMKNVIFDGKWTFLSEWKESSLTEMDGTDSGSIYLRTAHVGNYIYVMIDAVGVTHFEKNADRAIVCFDGKNDKAMIADADDYCVFATLGQNSTSVLQGGSLLGANSNFKKILTSDDFIGIGNISDENDRYSNTPHQSYEFRIPIDVMGRSNMYGFYAALYDTRENKIYSWPSMTYDSPLKIPSPNNWGEIVSPDKTLPEFELPLFALFPAFLFVLYFTRFKI